MPEPIRIEDLTVEDLAKANPDLVKRIQARAVEKAAEHRDALRAVVKATELPEDIQARLMDRVDGMTVDEAKRVCARAEAVEGSLASGKALGQLTDEDIETLRKDVADLPQATACAVIAGFVKAKRPAAAAAGNAPDTREDAEKSKDAAKAEAERLAPVKAEIEKARKDWDLIKANWVGMLTEAGYVREHLGTKNVKASAEDLAKACPELFEVKDIAPDQKVKGV